MKKILLAIIVLSYSANAQIKYYYLEACDEVVLQAVGNSISCLHGFYNDLQAYKKSSSFRFRYYESYNCIKQPDPKVIARTVAGTDVFYKSITGRLWKLYESAYAKGGEIVTYIRLEDYKTNLDKGFQLIQEMQQIHQEIADVRDILATKITTDAKALTATHTYVKPYQLYLAAIRHEEELLRKLSLNFNEDWYLGLPQDDILKSFLETEELLKNLKPSNFKLLDPAPLKSCYEGLEMLQKYKRTAVDEFNNTATFDGRYINERYQTFIKHFNSDILYFFAYLCAQARDNGFLVAYYPATPTKFDQNADAKPWALKNLTYSFPQFDSVVITKQPSPLPVAGFNELNGIVTYLNSCVYSMDDLFQQMRSEEYTWDRIRSGKIPAKNPIVKFDRFTIPMSQYALIKKYSKDIALPYRQPLVQRVDDVQQILLTLQDHLFGLSHYIGSGNFRNQNTDFLESELKIIGQLYNELDKRKEKLFLLVRQVYAAYPPAKANAWMTASKVLLKATDDSRSLLRQTEWRVYEQNQSSISPHDIHEGRRDLITNELKYMAGIQRIGKYNGLCPYTPYEYIPDYLNTLEEKILAMPVEVADNDKTKTYQDIRYMHNSIVERYNQFAELAVGDNEYGKNDPMRPVYLLAYIRQPMIYRYQPPKPPEKKVEITTPPEPVVEILIADIPDEPITFEGYPVNNLVLLLDVSSSMNKPGRLPLLKKDLTQIIKLMRKEDEISIVAYSGKAAVVLNPTSAQDTVKIIKTIQRLQSSGITNIADGLNLAYKTARDNFKVDGNNKIILATDGEFNLVESFYALAEKNAAEIPLSVFDFSEKPNPIPSIKTLAEKGAGNYIQIKPGNSLQMLAQEARKKN